MDYSLPPVYEQKLYTSATLTDDLRSIVFNKLQEHSVDPSTLKDPDIYVGSSLIQKRLKNYCPVNIPMSTGIPEFTDSRFNGIPPSFVKQILPTFNYYPNAFWAFLPEGVLFIQEFTGFAMWSKLTSRDPEIRDWAPAKRGRPALPGKTERDAVKTERSEKWSAWKADCARYRAEVDGLRAEYHKAVAEAEVWRVKLRELEAQKAPPWKP